MNSIGGGDTFREAYDCVPGGNWRHVARGKQVFTGDKFKNSATRTRPLPRGIRQTTTPAATRGCREDGI